MPAAGDSMDIDSDQENYSENSTMSRSRRTTQQRKLTYRNLLSKVEGILETEDVGLNTVKEIGEVLREANSLDTECKIDERIEQADETLLDCLVLSSASSVLKRCIQAVDVFTSTYEQSEFANKIINTVKSEGEDEIQDSDLLQLLDHARRIIPKVPKNAYIYGAYDLHVQPQPKLRKERQKVPKEKLQKKAPEKVTALNKEEEGIETIVKIQHDVLMEKYASNGQQPVKYYDFIIDTEDFANTIENMFYFSFLVRDGRAEIDLNGKGEPIIKPVRKNALKHFRDQGGVNTQIISYITMDQWKAFKKEGYLQQHKKMTSAANR